MAGIHTWPMVNIQAKKHDNFSVEFKFGFENNRTERKNNFAVKQLDIRSPEHLNQPGELR